MNKIFGFVFSIMFLCAVASAQAQSQGAPRGQDNNVYGNDAATAKPVSPYASNTGSYTVTKYKESKTKKKLRRGEARSRLSVPQPKGKPLKHKKKRKFLFFG
ncbi:hypothetical protein I5M27_01310 [Adhaeribacter sp. BT258]|uniref:Uncharacterized protein n=1 Tax=Adhaeribacter terrigena TaxID=2793070 RepID=A0ABS1BXG1_9BACT|nr:hypothetical protein [Adhaeribacter terrigena]MBK0401601.1 hypothetical protein [Adhaeribacter terrigena]